MAYSTEAIRNIALVGQAGAGKSSLLEALLLQAEAAHTRGVLYRDAQEKRFEHSLDTAVFSFEHRGTCLNLIDTPGYPDFLGRSLSVLEAVESAALVVNATAGVDVITQRLMDFA